MTQPPAPMPNGGVIPPRRVVFGIQLPVQATSERFSQGWEAAAGPRELLAVARAAESAGFFYGAVCDHVAIPTAAAPAIGPRWFDPLSTLSWLAGQTSRLRLLSHVLVLPYRHPLVAAKGFATLDALSGGRAILGVGAGHLEGEFDALGLDFRTRGAAVDDGIDLIRTALADEWVDLPASAAGVHRVAVAPRPTQAHLPIWVGGSSPAAIRRAATRGDGWLPQASPIDVYAEHVDRLLEIRTSVVGEVPVDLGALVGPIRLGSGSTNEVLEAIARFVEHGANHVQVSFVSDSAEDLADQLAAFGTDVLPLIDAGSQDAEAFEEPSFEDIRTISREHVAVMTSAGEDPDAWVAAGTEHVILTTKGRRSGRVHAVALPKWADDQGRTILVASYAGADRHPDWYLNLLDEDANPQVMVTTFGVDYWASPEVVTGDERVALWRALTFERPVYADYATRTSREIPLVRLLPCSPPLD